MIVRFTFTYLAGVRAAGRRRTEDVRLAGEVFADLPEVPSHAAPVAAWWQPPDHASRDCEVAVRSHEGVLLQPVCREGEGGDPDAFVRRGGMVPVAAADLAAGCPARAVMDTWPHVFGTEVSDGVVATLAPGCRVVDSLEESVAAGVRESVRHLYLVDGVLHRRILTPVLVADTLMGVRTGYVDDDHEDPTNVYRLDEHDAARAVPTLLPARGGVPAPEVAMPDVLGYDATALMVAGTAQSVEDLAAPVTDTSGYRGTTVPLDGMPRGMLAAWVDVRDARAAQASVEVLVEALRAFSEAGDGAQVDHATRRRLEQVGRCLARTDLDPRLQPDLSSLSI